MLLIQFGSIHVVLISERPCQCYPRRQHRHPWTVFCETPCIHPPEVGQCLFIEIFESSTQKYQKLFKMNLLSVNIQQISLRSNNIFYQRKDGLCSLPLPRSPPMGCAFKFNSCECLQICLLFSTPTKIIIETRSVLCNLSREACIR